MSLIPKVPKQLQVLCCDAVLDWRITFTSRAFTSTILDSGEAT